MILLCNLRQIFNWCKMASFAEIRSGKEIYSNKWSTELNQKSDTSK